jgi:hypothetical protein
MKRTCLLLTVALLISSVVISTSASAADSSSPNVNTASNLITINNHGAGH